ncbi:hypothetical protein AZE42_03661 [Rhizopogon vesiculosus]|uniref:Uncharacterized protein n=1 Tax=Rhizopogon vesiculosus TaxID=180088 RepID=A0A1J8PKD9_9AGAM|nr:hypothetical protein AZE42_03661 [Rhizopogon vesiculosus]
MLRQIRTSTIVLSGIRDLVTGPDFIPSSVAPIVNSCAAALSASKFSSLLQSRNIDGHSAMYWAIVNNRLEALSAFTGFISKLSSDCRSDLRLACIATSNHASFMQLNLGTIDSNYEPLQRSLGCPPDEIEVHEGDHDELEKHKFVALLRFKMCQKRLRITQNLKAEFVAGGRIWWLRIYMGPKRKWRMEWSLSQHSLPAYPDAVVVIEVQRGKPGCATPPQELRMVNRLTDTKFTSLIVPGT